MPSIPVDIQLCSAEFNDLLEQINEVMDPFRDEQVEVEVEIQCECGAETVYGPDCPGHSEFCPKYKQ